MKVVHTFLVGAREIADGLENVLANDSAIPETLEIVHSPVDLGGVGNSAGGRDDTYQVASFQR
jgi:hypothetical protein